MPVSDPRLQLLTVYKIKKVHLVGLLHVSEITETINLNRPPLFDLWHESY